MDRRREGDRAAAGERTGPARDPGRIGERNDDIVGCDLPHVGNDLSKDRLHPLALRGSTGGYIDLAGGIDAHGRTFERPYPGPLDIAADAESEIAALSARLALTLAERRDAADGIERFLQSARVISAVVDDRLAVAIEDARAIGHLLGADHVAPAHLRRLQSQTPGHEVDNPLHREHRFRTPRTTVSRVRDLVGCGRARRDGEMLDLVGAGQMSGSVVGHTTTDRVPRPAIDDEIVAQRQDVSITVKADFDLVQLVARMRRGQQMLVPVMDTSWRCATIS